jgi:ATP-binding cassette subfamily B protein
VPMSQIAAEPFEEEALTRTFDGRLMARLLRYLVPYRLRAALAVALLIVSSFLQLVGPLATAVVLDLFVLSDPDRNKAVVSLWVEGLLAGWNLDLSPAGGVTLVAGFYGLTLLLSFGVLFCQAYVMEMMGQRIMFDIRRDIFGRLQELPVAFFDRNPIGRMVTRATTDVAALNELFTAGLVSIFGDIFLLGGILWMLFALNYELALVSFSILPLLFGLTFWFKHRVRRSFREVRLEIARINSFLQEHLTGMSIVQLFNRERRALEDFSEVNAGHRDANIRSIFYYAIYFPGIEFITVLGLALIVWYGGGQILSGALSFGALVAFLQFAQRFYRPLADLSDKYNILQAAMASAERIFLLLDEEVTIHSPEDAHRPGEIRGEIELDGVGFSYNPGEPVLHDVSLRIAPGETVAVVGHTGAGKSTLANLLLRFYDVDSGSVRIDGVDVRRWDLRTLRRSIAMVLQDVFLFSGDVASNIHLGDEAIDPERLRRAAREVHALEFIERLPQGFSTTVRERGAGLSVGQKQLIAFARALAFDPKILILDEATASIDTETEQKIQLALERLLEDRTSLVIAHRLSTIQRADRIVVMHKGCIREVGTHRELLAQGGIYHKLHQLQYREQDSIAAP